MDWKEDLVIYDFRFTIFDCEGIITDGGRKEKKKRKQRGKVTVIWDAVRAKGKVGSVSRNLGLHTYLIQHEY